MRNLSIAALVAATVSLAGVGGAQTPATWDSSPGSGPSPNTIQVEGNECRINPSGEVIPGEAIVRLYAPDGTTVIQSQTYTSGSDGVWGGAFAIPAGLDPATYPLRARCGPPGNPTGEPGFDYTPDRSYRVIGAGRPRTPSADPVDAEVTFTG